MERKLYSNELAAIKQLTLEMGHKTVDAVKFAAQALINNDAEIAGKARSLEKEVDGMYRQIDDRCIVSIATQQPMAGDLRFLVSTLKIATEIERIAVNAVIAHEEAQGRIVESVEADNRGFDLISRMPHPEDPRTAIDVRFIEVKGRSHIGEVALTSNEYRTAQRLANDYWLYVVFHCATPTPNINILRNPATLEWQPVVKVEHYKLNVSSIRSPVELNQDRAEYNADKN